MDIKIVFISLVIIATGGIIYYFSLEGNLFQLHMADVDIRSNLSQVRNDAEMYYYKEGGESYSNYKYSEGWKELSRAIPKCSRERLKEELAANYPEEYQLKIRGEEYIAWAPLCRTETVYCIDSFGNSVEMKLDEIENAIKTIKCASN